jgi:hypothetical protein
MDDATRTDGVRVRRVAEMAAGFGYGADTGKSTEQLEAEERARKGHGASDDGQGAAQQEQQPKG